jgi:hypothetical protein
VRVEKSVTPVWKGFDKLAARHGKGARVDACCGATQYQFSVSGVQDPFGFVGMRLGNTSDGGVLWEPLVLERRGREWQGRFSISPVFRAYTSTFSKGEGKVLFFLKQSVYGKELFLGALDLEGSGSRKTLESNPLLASVAHTSRSSLHEDSEFLVTLPKESLAKDFDYELLLVPISDGRIQIRSTRIPLVLAQNGDYLARVPIDMSGNLRSPVVGRGFGGVLGAVLRSHQGEVFGKFQIGYLNETTLTSATSIETSRR